MEQIVIFPLMKVELGQFDWGLKEIKLCNILFPIQNQKYVSETLNNVKNFNLYLIMFLKSEISFSVNFKKFLLINFQRITVGNKSISA